MQQEDQSINRLGSQWRRVATDLLCPGTYMQTQRELGGIYAASSCDDTAHQQHADLWRAFLKYVIGLGPRSFMIIIDGLELSQTIVN